MKFSILERNQILRSGVLALVLNLLIMASAFAQRDPNAFASLGTLNISSGTLTINTDTGQMTGAASFTGAIATQAGGPQIAVFDFNSINIGAAVTINVTGSRALSLLSRGGATISGMMSLNGSGTEFSGSFAAGSGGYIGAYAAVSGLEANGLGPGGGPGISTPFALGLGGGHGGAGGSRGTTAGGGTYGNLAAILQGGSGGGAYSNGGATFGGGGGGALEIVGVGSVTVGSIFARGGGGFGNGSGSGSGGGGAGGGILILGSTVTFTGLNADGGNGGGSNINQSGGGGGRVLLSGIGSYSLGAAVSGVSLQGGTSQASSTGLGYAGVLTVDANSTTITSGQSLNLNGNPVISVAGSTTNTAHTVEAYVRKNLVIDSGGIATLGVDNALRRLDSSGNNITSLTVNGTFNTGAYSQIVSTFNGSGAVNLGTGGSILVGENNGTSTYSGSTAGAGSLVKTGGGTLTLSGTSIGHTGATIVQAGTLEFAPASGTVAVTSPISGVGQIAKSGAGITVLSGNNTYTGNTAVNAGTLRAGSSTAFGSNSNFSLANAAGVTLDLGSNNVAIGSLAGGGGAGGTVLLGANTLTVGGGTASPTFNGSISGTGSLVKNGLNSQVLAGNNGYTGTTTVRDGVLQFDSGLTTPGGTVRVENTGTLQANASITRSIAGSGPDSTINVGASGITLGNASSFAGFSHQGVLNVGANTVTLASAGQPRLGQLTTIGNGVSAGTMTAANGVVLDFGTAVTGRGLINTPNIVANRNIINGHVQGDSLANPITFNGWVKGIGTFDNVQFAGTFDPGFSPTLLSVGNLGFAPTNTLIMELGGITRGAQYDAIDASGTLSLDGTLEVQLINGFNPVVGNSFDFFNWSTLIGTFSFLDLPTLGVGLTWDTSQLYSVGRIFVVPEPTAILMALAAAAAGIFFVRRLNRFAQNVGIPSCRLFRNLRKSE